MIVQEVALEEVLKQVKDRWLASWKNSKGFDCKMIGPETKCFCNHKFKDHNYMDVSRKSIHCTEKKCPCPEFFYIPSEASYDFKCLCKLSFKLHDAITKKGPRCQGFKSTWTCSCGKRWEEHGTVFERRREREKGGRITDDTGIMMEKMEGAENTRRTEEGKRKKEEGKMEEGRRREMQDEGNATEKRERRRMEENDIWGLQDGIKENKEVHQKQDTSFLLKKAALSTLNSKIMVENLENQSQIPLQTFKNYLLDEEPSCYLLFTTPHFYRRRVWKKDLE